MDDTDAGDNNARVEGSRGDPGGGESVIDADSSNAASLRLSLSCCFCFFLDGRPTLFFYLRSYRCHWY
jgi:hypothetical protein